MHANNCKGRVRGACHPKAKTPDSDVEMIVYLHDEYGMGYKALAKKFGLPRSTVRNFCNGRTRSTLE
jgi:antitoxin component HigA of HigAB toxin-antitoxin module